MTIPNGQNELASMWDCFTTFLNKGLAPLEPVYQTTWKGFPAVLKKLLEKPAKTPPRS